MKCQMKKLVSMLGTVGLLSAAAAGCGSAPGSDTSASQIVELSSPAAGHPEQSETTPAQNDADTAIPNTTDATNPDTAAVSTSNSTDTAAPDATGNTEGRWHVLPPETAAIIDADFIGDVWKIEESSFYVAEEFVEILDDGSILGSLLSTDADVPDTDLVPVAFDENTHFYIRTIYNGGERYEDSEGSFQDIEKYLTVEMKGSFVNDVFQADEIRITKVV